MQFFSPLSFRHRCSKTERDAQHFILNVKGNSLFIQYEVLHFGFTEDRGCAAAACRGEAAEVEERWKRWWGVGILLPVHRRCSRGLPWAFPTSLCLSVPLFCLGSAVLFFFSFRGFPCYSCISPQPGPSSTPSPNPYEAASPYLLPSSRWGGQEAANRCMKIRI